MPIAVIIDWYGPFDSFAEFSAHVGANWHGKPKCIYMAYGTYNRLRYIGLTKNPTGRFQNHPKMQSPENRRFYIGEITSQGVSGKRNKATRPDLDLTELALIRALDPSENDRRKAQVPDDCVSIYSRFFDKDVWETPRPRPNKFPAFVGYDSYRQDWDILF